MDSKFSIKGLWLIISAVGIALFAVFIFFLIKPAKPYSRENPPSMVAGATTESSGAVNLPEVKSISLPATLLIPKIHVNTAVEFVGLTKSGAMDVPKDSGNVAWYNLGPRPGETGSAVIAGHFGLKNGKPTVFENLHLLSVGDEIFVEDEVGRTQKFVVRAITTFSQDADASTVFSSNDGKAHLNLVTCKGAWDIEKKSYPDRLVVFTDEEM